MSHTATTLLTRLPAVAVIAVTAMSQFHLFAHL